MDGDQVTYTTQQFALCQHQHVLAGEQITAPSTSICITVTLAIQRTNYSTKISNFNADNELEPFATGRILFLWTGASVPPPGCLSSWTRRPATPAWWTVSVPSNPQRPCPPVPDIASRAACVLDVCLSGVCAVSAIHTVNRLFPWRRI